MVNHRALYERFMVVFPELDPFAYAYESIPGDNPKGTDLDDPGAVALWPDREEYYRDPNKGTIVFTGDLTLHVGDHTFNVLSTPGHTPGQLAVHVPEERVVFTGDTIFSGCQTWLMTSDVEQWLAALERIRALDVDQIIPGHGPVVPMQYLDVQRAQLMEWKTAVASAIAAGWSREETIARVNFADRFGPVDIGQGYMLQYIQNLNAGFALRQADRGDPRRLNVARARSSVRATSPPCRRSSAPGGSRA